MDVTPIILAVLASSGVWAVVNTIASYVIERMRAKTKPSISKDEFETHSKALRGLLYGELERRCTEYIHRGRISAGELNDLRKYYYEPYRSLNGDGTIERLFQRVEALDIGEE